MDFADTYHDQVIQSRRDRSRRAHFWARVLGIVLAVTCLAVLRAEPDLRRALVNAAVNGVSQVAGLNSTPTSAKFTQAATPAQQQPKRLSRSEIKVNRPAGGLSTNLQTLAPADIGSMSPTDIAKMADAINQNLSGLQLNY